MLIAPRHHTLFSATRPAPPGAQNRTAPSIKQQRTSQDEGIPTVNAQYLWMRPQ